MQDALIIFYKNPILSKVKTRLAATIGDPAALNVYLRLAAHTRTITSSLNLHRALYYSDFINTEDEWPASLFHKKLQTGTDLGIRMSNAFAELFGSGFKKVAIIGSDCAELTTDILEAGFSELDNYDVVTGPAMDGGYYFLGLNAFHAQLFHNKTWSTNTVHAATVYDCHRLSLAIHHLPILRDVDVEDDLPREWKTGPEIRDSSRQLPL